MTSQQTRHSRSVGSADGYIVLFNEEAKEIPAEGKLTYPMEEGQSYKVAFARKYGEGWGSVTQYKNGNAIKGASLLCNVNYSETIVLTKITAAQNEVAPSYHISTRLYSLAVVFAATIIYIVLYP